MTKILAISISTQKGVQKTEIQEAVLRENHGIEGEIRSGPGMRQLSFLASESKDQIRDKNQVGLCVKRFAENITTEGVSLSTLPLGTKLQIGEEAVIEMTQIGKKCHSECEAKHLADDCVMTREGIFGRVIKGGKIFTGDEIKVLG